MNAVDAKPNIGTSNRRAMDTGIFIAFFAGGQPVEVVVDHAVILNSEEKFVMPSGIHKGRSLDEIAHLEGGLKYIEFIGKKAPK